MAGLHGLEARYPFLDRDVIQEFLWLTHDLKNSEYKAPIEYYLREHDYPFLPRKKLGFSADKNLTRTTKYDEQSYIESKFLYKKDTLGGLYNSSMFILRHREYDIE